MNKLKLIVNNTYSKKEKFFIRKELQTILNLYARKVSSGDWKDYGLSINRKEITFDVYQRTSERPIYKISKNLSPKNNIEKFYVLDKNGRVIKRSDSLERLIKKIDIDEVELTDKEVDAIISFLYSLTGKTENTRPLGKPSSVPSGLLVD